MPHHSSLGLGPASCQRCRHHVTLESSTLVCRRFPPSVSIIAVPQRSIAGDMLVPQPFSTWPTVPADANCGEFSPAFGIAQ